MIKKWHVDLTAGALALAAGLEAAVEVVGGADLTWNAVALGVAFGIQAFVNNYKTGAAADAAEDAPSS